jgi:hypothetical protein
VEVLEGVQEWVEEGAETAREEDTTAAISTTEISSPNSSTSRYRQVTFATDVDSEVSAPLPLLPESCVVADSAVPLSHFSRSLDPAVSD